MSSFAYAIEEHKYEGFINPNQPGIYVLNQGSGSVKYCQTVAADEDNLVTACTPFSGEYHLTPGVSQDLLDQIFSN